ncbi:MAG: hypothetical protein WC657_00880 [Candidatus Paceibacterota bacterium]|jgi:hypothetical protein
MFRKPLFLETFILLATVGILNYFATRYHLYWSTYEFDSLVHFLGGATLSAFFLWAYFFSGFFDPQKRKLKNFLLVAFLGAMSVAIIWEIYEIFLGEVAVSGAEYPYDTMMDLIMDFLGIMAFCFYGYMREYNQKMIIKNQNE